ncbi:MAG: THUMP domain-containing protein [Burkholderiaceae bacterium]
MTATKSQIAAAATETATDTATGDAGPPTYFAPCPKGLQDYLAQEVTSCGGLDVQVVAAGVQFSGTLAVAYQVNLRSRIASRVLMRVASKRYRIDKDLYKIASRVPWEAYFGPELTLRVDIRAVRSNLRSLQIATLRVKDAVVDRLREHTGDRPSIDTNAPDVRVAIYLEDRQASLYVDLSGENLFKRGWRLSDDKGSAPIKENLAAGLLAASGWDYKAPLYDPFCGSGTIAIEAAQLVNGVRPQLREQFGLHRLRSFDSEAWQLALTQADRGFESGRANATTVNATGDRASPEAATVYASDIDNTIIERTRSNIIRAGLSESAVHLRTADFLNSSPPTRTPGWLVSNLPYGERMDFVGKGDVFREMGARLKKSFNGWTVCLLTSDLKLPGKLGLRERRKIPLYNGTLDCRLFIFDIR